MKSNERKKTFKINVAKYIQIVKSTLLSYLFSDIPILLVSYINILNVK